MTDATSDHLRLERQGRVAWITFNRPDARNAMTFAMYDRLHDLCERLDRDPDVRVLVLRGAGDQAFASGTDIRQFLDFTTREDAVGYEARLGRAVGRVHAMAKPTIAMVQGDAVGGGLFIALACDLRIAASHARFGAPIARTLGNCIVPSAFALFAAAVGPVRARNILLTARLVDAGEATSIGLVDEVHPADRLQDRVGTLAAGLADLAPLTLAAAKEAMRRVMRGEALRDAEDMIVACYLSEDFKEGVRAFLDKRKADWHGR